MAEGFGVSPESMYRVLEQHLADELYTVTYENKIVACVFVEPAAVDLDGGVKAVNVQSLTVSPQHRRRRFRHLKGGRYVGLANFRTRGFGPPSDLRVY